MILDHTWSEGLHACKARSHSKTVIGQQLNEAKHQTDVFSKGAGITAAKPLALISAPMSGAPPVIATALMPANTSTAYTSLMINSTPITAAVTTIMPAFTDMSTPVHIPVTSQGCRQMLDITVYITLPPLYAFSISLFI